jgi:hypothetical protein
MLVGGVKWLAKPPCSLKVDDGEAIEYQRCSRGRSGTRREESLYTVPVLRLSDGVVELLDYQFSSGHFARANHGN